MADSLNLSKFVNNIKQRHNDKLINEENIWDAIRNSLSIDKLVNNLAETFRLPLVQIENDLRDLGFSELIAQSKLKNSKVLDKTPGNQLYICNDEYKLNPFPDLFKVKANPRFLNPINLSKSQKEIFSDLFNSFIPTFNNDPFLKLYREGVLDYYRNYMASYGVQITEYINKQFQGGYPKYLVTTGIGANEQFNHFTASINNTNKNRRLTWLTINSPKRLSLLPDEANLKNTLFMEFSRSSITEETVKIHEYTPRETQRIVFCNGGPLLALAQRDGNLIQPLPDQVSGRYGRNKTPILLAPMLVAGMDIETFWKNIELSINTFNLTDPDSLPVVIAKYIFLYQRQMEKNFIYFGCNDDKLLLLADEFVQFWNEGVNKNKNDLLVSRFFGLPRDSHMNIEGLLGNHKTKMAIFLLRTNMRHDTYHPLISQILDPIKPEHMGLNFGDEEVILSYANYERFSDLMPTILFDIPCNPTLTHAAVISQLFADTTFVYSRFCGIDPGSNPEVKAVRERSAMLLSKVASKIRSGIEIEKAIEDQ